MADDDIVPHFERPFRLDGSSFAVLDQDTHQEVFECVVAVVNTPKGSRLELPKFGISDLTFREGGPSARRLFSEILDSEPRADLVVDIDNVTEIADRVSNVEIDVEGDGS